MSTYTVRKTGQPFTPEYRAYIEQDGKVVSAWHDIPLYPEGEDNKNVLNMVVEIPRWSNAKMEVSTYTSPPLPSQVQVYMYINRY
mgnify:CR=1 FL=1